MSQEYPDLYYIPHNWKQDYQLPDQEGILHMMNNPNV